MGKLQSVSRIPTIIGASHVAADLWAARFAQRSGYNNGLLSCPSITLFQFFEQLLFQVPARCFLNRAPLCCYCFLLRLAFSSCPWLGHLRQVPDLRPMSADFSLFWFCVRIHENNRLRFVSRHHTFIDSSFGFRHCINSCSFVVSK